jgi:hypothetical protein
LEFSNNFLRAANHIYTSLTNSPWIFKIHQFSKSFLTTLPTHFYVSSNPQTRTADGKEVALWLTYRMVQLIMLAVASYAYLLLPPAIAWASFSENEGTIVEQ